MGAWAAGGVRKAWALDPLGPVAPDPRSTARLFPSFTTKPIITLESSGFAVPPTILIEWVWGLRPQRVQGRAPAFHALPSRLWGRALAFLTLS